MKPRFEIVDYAELPGVACPCGTARRAWIEADDFPATIHRTEIDRDARRHYHKRLTEVYYFLEVAPGGRMELDDQQIEVRAGMSILIRPGTRHRAIGRMTVLIVCSPKFDPADEWFDEKPIGSGLDAPFPISRTTFGMGQRDNV